ncbi:unnamed protein product [Mytilus coruscus]|uniref:Ig-like domain-containing protein n=1 Tax=Mytilus coruscus TaxID=42192 RepID=A0A6J8DWI8_MYTCO|nr:unnamed protein product [Mytilus coruscus]
MFNACNALFVELQFLNQTDNNIMYGQEGYPINISCASAKGYDVKELLIYQYGRQLATSKTSIVIFSFVPNRHSFSNFYCMEKSNPDADVHVKLVVYYAPDVKVFSRENSIECHPNGFPDTYTFHGLEHKSEKGVQVRFLDGSNNRTLILQNIRMQYKISGIYVCIVSNRIPDVTGSISQTGFTYFSYQVIDVLTSKAKSAPSLLVIRNENRGLNNIYIVGDGISIEVGKTVKRAIEVILMTLCI